MNHEKDLLLLFDEIVEEESQPVKFSEDHIDEQKRLENLYNLSQNNIDKVFDNLSNLSNISESKFFVGAKFGNRTIINSTPMYKIYKNFSVFKLYECDCTCGNIRFVESRSLMLGKADRCNRCPSLHKKEYIVGETYGNKKVLSVYYDENRKQNKRRIEYECFICKKIFHIGTNIFSKNESCHGCAKIENHNKKIEHRINTIINGYKILSIIRELTKHNTQQIKYITECQKCFHKSNKAYEKIIISKQCQNCIKNSWNEGIEIGRVLKTRTIIDIKMIRNEKYALCRCICGDEKFVACSKIRKGLCFKCSNCYGKYKS